MNVTATSPMLRVYFIVNGQTKPIPGNGENYYSELQQLGIFKIYFSLRKTYQTDFKVSLC